jgi:hypothetical protein
MNTKTEQMLDKLAKRYGLYKHIKPGGDKGGLRGTEPGTLWVNWAPLRRAWKVKPQGDSWSTPVRTYLRSVVGRATYFSGVDGWHVTDEEVVEAAVRVMARTQGLEPTVTSSQDAFLYLAREIIAISQRIEVLAEKARELLEAHKQPNT